MDLDRGRDAFQRASWTEAYTHLSAAAAEGSVPPEDVVRFATAAYLVGEDLEAIDALTKAHRAFEEGDDLPGAVRSAVWLGFMLMEIGEGSRGAGWFARANRMVADVAASRVEQGWALVPQGRMALGRGERQAAHDAFSTAVRLGEQHGDRDLVCFARHGLGRTLVRMGRIEQGIALLDEAMIALETEELSPIITGIVYCSAIEACQEVADLQRARSWTATLATWCERQEGLVPFRGQCLVLRSEILRLQGDWLGAITEAERAAVRLTSPRPRPAAGAAYYQRAELHRLRGEFDEAEDEYAAATQWGRSPQPGLALLRLDQGRTDAARSAIERVLAEAEGPIPRSKALPAYVAILVAAGDAKKALEAAEEFAAIAGELDVEALRAEAAYARGAARLADDRPEEALGPLRTALAAWEALDVPFEAARSRALVAAACRALGDDDTAQLHEDAARQAFESLGAHPELERLDATREAAEQDSLLTPRELEVLRLVAAGRTNREIGTDLGISERTVERHVSNFFDKLGVSSRTAATAYAYQNDLL